MTTREISNRSPRKGSIFQEFPGSSPSAMLFTCLQGHSKIFSVRCQPGIHRFILCHMLPGSLFRRKPLDSLVGETTIHGTSSGVLWARSS